MNDSLSEMPRYLQIAHWLLEQQQWMSARQVSLIFDVPLKRVCDDFSVLRQRRDLFELDERERRCRNGYECLMKVVGINSYTLDRRLHPQVSQFEPIAPKSNIAWRNLVSRPWHKLTD